MAVEAGIIRILVDVQSEKATTALKKTEKQLKDTGKSAKGMGKGTDAASGGMKKMGVASTSLGKRLLALMANPIMLAIAGIALLGKIMFDSVKAYDATVVSQKNLTTAMKAGGNESDAQIERLNKMADALELTTGTGDDVIRNLFAQADGWGMTGAEIEKYGTEIVAIKEQMDDMGLNGDKALESLAKGGNEARKVFAAFGVELSDEDEALIAAADSSDQLAMRIKALKDAGADFGAPFEDTADKMEMLKARLGNIQELIGERLLPHVLKFADVLIKAFDDNKPMIDALGNAIGDIGETFFDLITLAKQIRDLLSSLGMDDSLEASVKMVIDAFSFLKNLVKSLVAVFNKDFALAGLYFKKALDDMIGFTIKFVQLILGLIKTVVNGFLKLAKLMPEGLSKAINIMIGAFKWYAGAIIGYIGFIAKGWETAINGMITGFEWLVNGVIKGINLILKAWNLLPTGMKDIEMIAEMSMTKLDNVDNFIDGIQAAIDDIGEVEITAEGIDELIDSVKDMGDDLDDFSILTDEDLDRLDELNKDLDIINEDDEDAKKKAAEAMDDSNNYVRENITKASNMLNQNFDELFKDISRSIMDPRTGNLGAFATNILSQSPSMTSAFTGGFAGQNSITTVTTDVILDGQKVGKAMTNSFRQFE